MMKRTIFGLAFVTSAWALAAPTPAAVTAGSQWTAATYEAGRCIVRADRGAAAALMRTLPLDDSPADLGALRGRAARCAEGAAGATAVTMRGAIAQALYLSDFRGRELRPVRPGYLVDLGLPVQGAPGGSRTVELYRWADCVVRNDSATTRRLLMSPLGSSEETAAITALNNYMAACLPQGADLNVYASEVRDLFAQTAYASLYRYWTGQLRGPSSRARD